jgi:hypothetical protein
VTFSTDQEIGRSSLIFISYRRKDTGGHTGRLYDRLIQRFDKDDVFYDQSAIESGDDFPFEIQNALDSAQVILIVIGPDWLSEENRKRLEDPKDFVRQEVLSALRRRETESPNNFLVIPLLVGGAEPLAEGDLPVELHKLSFTQAQTLSPSYNQYNLQINDLFRVIEKQNHSWTAKQKQWFLNCLADKNLSSAHFGQNLSVLVPESHYIPRTAANEAIDGWWSEWQQHHRPFVLLGEEGDGKTWAASSWVAKTVSLNTNDMPVIFLPATKVSGRADFIAEMAEAMARANDSMPASGWESRLKFFLSSTDSKNLQMLVVVDGLNERPSLDWRDFLDNYLVSRFRKYVAVIITCRTGYWNEHLKNEYKDRIATWTLPPYHDAELDHALARHHFTRASFSDRVLRLVAKPRYFDMAIRLKDQLEDSGDDVTIDRLIYEDWKDRLGRKRSSGTKISHRDFHALITEVVRKYGERVSVTQLAQTLSVFGNQADIRAELVDSGILKAVGGGKFEVSPNPLILGLGLLLAAEIEESGKGEILEIEEIIAERLGPHADSDRLVQICAMALFHALLTDKYPDAGSIALFRKWISGRNLDQADSERVSAYFPLRPRVYFQVMEDLWGTFGNYREVEDHLMSAMLQPQNFGHVKNEMVATFDRWLGFVHRLGYRGWYHHEESEKEGLIKSVEERLGQEPRTGVVELFGHRIEIVAEQRLLQLAKVAESVISHFDREPFVHGISSGAIATAIMGGSIGDFSWVIRTASNDAQESLLGKAKELMATGVNLALLSADYLLFWVCNPDSLALRESIPEALSSRRWKNRFSEEDGSNSAFYLWSEENYVDYLQRTQLPSVTIAENLRGVAINPFCTLPTAVLGKIDNAVKDVGYEAPSHCMQTREDIAIENMEPALCAYIPERYAELYRSLATQLNGKDGLSCRLLASKLYQHLAVFTEPEKALILQAWRTSLAAEGQEAADSECVLFPMVIFDRSPEEQLGLVRERGRRTQYLLNQKAQYRKTEAISLTAVTEILNSYNGSSSDDYYNLIDYISKTSDRINDILRESLLKLFRGDSSVIRYLCLEIICKFNDQPSAQMVIDSGWRVEGQNCDHENRWGSFLLSKYGGYISFTELAERIFPEWLGYAVKKRGNVPAEVEDYALRLHMIWTRIAKPTDSDNEVLRHVKIQILEDKEDVEEITSVNLTNAGIKWRKFTWGGTSGAVADKVFDADTAEAELGKVFNQVMELYAAEKKRGNHWIDISFSNGNLDAVVASGVTVWREWISPLLDGTIEGRRLLALCQGLYESLCATLLKLEPEIGAKLFRAIVKHRPSRIVDSATDIPHLLFSLFEAEESVYVRELWNELRDGCDSDKALSELAHLAQSCGKGNWFDQTIKSYLDSDIEYDRARGLRLLGFSTEEKHMDQLQAWVDGNGRSWLMDVAKEALQCGKRNLWARTWLERFIKEEDRVKSWAAFRLFLRCVDKRFRIWGKELINIGELQTWKRDAYRGNLGAIFDAVKENEKKSKDTFISHDVKDNQLWPWMKRYL